MEELIHQKYLGKMIKKYIDYVYGRKTTEDDTSEMPTPSNVP